MHQITLLPPDGFTEANIAGSVYQADADGQVRTTNPDHAEVMVKHGLKIVTEDPTPYSPGLGLIDCEELGRGALADALRERGLTPPDGADRPALVAIAENWNVQFRAGLMATQRPTHVAEPLAPSSFPPPSREPTPQNGPHPGTAPALTAAAAPSQADPALQPAGAPTVAAMTTDLTDAAMVSAAGQAVAPAAHVAPTPTPTPEKPDFATLHHKKLEKWLKDEGIEVGALATAAQRSIAAKHWEQKYGPAPAPAEDAEVI